MSVEVITNPVDTTAEEVLSLYRDHEWWTDRTETEVEGALTETDVFVGLRDMETDRLIACARVLTDFTYYARIYDVIVAEGRRGEGIGERLIHAVVDLSDLQDVDLLHLDCPPGLVGYYEKSGFRQRDALAEHEAMVSMVLRRSDT